MLFVSLICDAQPPSDSRIGAGPASDSPSPKAVSTPKATRHRENTGQRLSPKVMAAGEISPLSRTHHTTRPVPPQTATFPKPPPHKGGGSSFYRYEEVVELARHQVPVTSRVSIVSGPAVLPLETERFRLLESCKLRAGEWVGWRATFWRFV